jgi:hypothetical protein
VTSQAAGRSPHLSPTRVSWDAMDAWRGNPVMDPGETEYIRRQSGYFIL